MNFGTALRKELLEQLRSYRMLITAVVLTLFGLLSPIIARYTPDIIRMALPQGEEITKLIPRPRRRIPWPSTSRTSPSSGCYWRC